MSETRSSLLRSTPFRLALTFAFLFLLAFILSGAVVYQLMSASLARQLDQSIKETYSLIAATHAESDEEDLVATVRDHAQFSQDKDEIFSLTDKGGNRLAGDFTASSLPDGFSMFAANLPGVPRDTEYRAYSGTVGDNNLTVAFSLSETEDLERIVLMSFGWATLFITVLAIGGGAVLASRVQRRGVRHEVAVQGVVEQEALGAHDRLTTSPAGARCTSRGPPRSGSRTARPSAASA